MRHACSVMPSSRRAAGSASMRFKMKASSSAPLADAIVSAIGLPTDSLTGEEASTPFGWLKRFATANARASSARTRTLTGWMSRENGLLESSRRMATSPCRNRNSKENEMEFAVNGQRHSVTLTAIVVSLMMSSQAHSQSDASAAVPSERTYSTTLPVTDEGMIVAPAESLREFRPLVPGHADGPNIREIEGDPMVESSIILFRYRNNYEGSRRLHTHTYTYRSILIEGEMKHWDANGSEETATVLKPGSYWRQPGGELHADHCMTERCLALVIFEGKIDADFRGDLLRRRAEAR